MKVYYMNDEQKEITLRILDANYDHTGGDNSLTFHKMKPCEGRLFDVAIPEGGCLWVKKWPGMVMLSYLDQSGLAQVSLRDEQLRTGDGAVKDRD
jgi:hypothetical protein